MFTSTSSRSINSNGAIAIDKAPRNVPLDPLEPVISCSVSLPSTVSALALSWRITKIGLPSGVFRQRAVSTRVSTTSGRNKSTQTELCSTLLSVLGLNEDHARLVFFPKRHWVTVASSLLHLYPFCAVREDLAHDPGPSGCLCPVPFLSTTRPTTSADQTRSRGTSFLSMLFFNPFFPSVSLHQAFVFLRSLCFCFLTSFSPSFALGRYPFRTWKKQVCAGQGVNTWGRPEKYTWLSTERISIESQPAVWKPRSVIFFSFSYFLRFLRWALSRRLRDMGGIGGGAPLPSGEPSSLAHVSSPSGDMHRSRLIRVFLPLVSGLPPLSHRGGNKGKKSFMVSTRAFIGFLG